MANICTAHKTLFMIYVQKRLEGPVDIYTLEGKKELSKRE